MRAEKELLLDEVKAQVEGANAFLITRYAGLSAGLATDFRRELRKSDSAFTVVKKRLLRKAAEKAGIDLGGLGLDGHIGVVVAGEDSVEAIKAVYAFSKDNGNIIEVLAGQVDGTMYSSEQVEKLSNLPSTDEMRAQFLGLLEAPMAQTLSVMQSLLTSVIYCLDNKAKASN